MIFTVDYFLIDGNLYCIRDPPPQPLVPTLTVLFPTSNLSPSMQSCILPTEEPGEAEEVLAGLRE